MLSRTEYNYRVASMICFGNRIYRHCKYSMFDLNFCDGKGLCSKQNLFARFENVKMELVFRGAVNVAVIKVTR